MFYISLLINPVYISYPKIIEIICLLLLFYFFDSVNSFSCNWEWLFVILMSDGKRPVWKEEFLVLASSAVIVFGNFWANSKATAIRKFKKFG